MNLDDSMFQAFLRANQVDLGTIRKVLSSRKTGPFKWFKVHSASDVSDGMLTKPMFTKAIMALGIPGMSQASIDKMFNDLAELSPQKLNHAVSITLIDNIFKAFNRFQRIAFAPRTVQESLL